MRIFNLAEDSQNPRRDRTGRPIRRGQGIANVQVSKMALQAASNLRTDGLLPRKRQSKNCDQPLRSTPRPSELTISSSQPDIGQESSGFQWHSSATISSTQSPKHDRISPTSSHLSGETCERHSVARVEWAPLQLWGIPTPKRNTSGSRARAGQRGLVQAWCVRGALEQSPIPFGDISDEQ